MNWETVDMNQPLEIAAAQARAKNVLSEAALLRETATRILCATVPDLIIRTEEDEERVIRLAVSLARKLIKAT